MAKFCPLFSGSKGNSTYIATTEGAILIDVGVSAKKMTEAIEKMGVGADFIKAILITHTHSDHIGGLRVFAKKHKIPVFASKKTVEALRETDGYESVEIFEISDGLSFGDISVTHFPTPHDCEGSCGYVVYADDRKIAVCTDIGKITDEIHENLCGSDLVMLESNHDVLMLQSCAYYSYELKRRILSEVGHLSNNACAEELCRLAKSGTTRFVLSHLSENTNMPSLALQSAFTTLSAAGYRQDIDYTICAADVCNNNVIIL